MPVKLHTRSARLHFLDDASGCFVSGKGAGIHSKQQPTVVGGCSSYFVNARYHDDAAYMQAIYTANLAPVFMMERSYAFKLPNVSHALELAVADPSTPMTMCVNEGSANAVRG